MNKAVEENQSEKITVLSQTKNDGRESLLKLPLATFPLITP